MSHPIDVSIKTVIKVALVALGFWVAYLISDILIIIAFAVIISSAIDNWARYFQRINIPVLRQRTIAVMVIYLLAISVLAGIFYLVIPIFVKEINNLTQDLPKYYDQISAYLGTDYSSAQSLIFTKMQDFTAGIEEKLLQAGGGLLTVFKGIFSGVVMIVATFVLSFYLALQENGVRKFLQFITPKRYENHVLDLWQRAQTKLGNWLQGQLLLGFIIGILVFVALSILGIPYAPILALLAAIFELVPVAGPIIAAIPAVLLAFLISPIKGLITLIVYFIIQQTENHIIVPNVMRKAVGLNPVVIIIALLVGAKLGGIIGMLLAVPAAAVLMEVLREKGEDVEGLKVTGSKLDILQ